MKTIKLLFFIVLLVTIQTLTAQTSKSYYFTKTLSGTMDDVTLKVKTVLQNEGFGTVIEIDMDVKINEKVKDANLKPYKIIGVCNPGFAYQTIKIEENIGLFLPCKAIIKDLGNGQVEVVLVNPTVLMEMLNNPALVEVAAQVTEKFKDAMNNL